MESSAKTKSGNLVTLVSPVAYLRERGFVVERIAGTIDEYDIVAPVALGWPAIYNADKRTIVNGARRLSWRQRAEEIAMDWKMSTPTPTPVAMPKTPDAYPDRALDCEFALEPAFQALRDAGIAAGWTEEEISQALIGVAQANYRGMIEDAAVDTRLMLFNAARERRD